MKMHWCFVNAKSTCITILVKLVDMCDCVNNIRFNIIIVVEARLISYGVNIEFQN